MTPTSEDLLIDLIDHLMAMRDDAYLMGHPEWTEIIEEVKQVRRSLEENEHA